MEGALLSTIIATQLVNTLGVVYFLSNRIDASHRELGARIDASHRELGARINALSARTDAHIERHAP